MTIFDLPPRFIRGLKITYAAVSGNTASDKENVSFLLPVTIKRHLFANLIQLLGTPSTCSASSGLMETFSLFFLHLSCVKNNIRLVVSSKFQFRCLLLRWNSSHCQTLWCQCDRVLRQICNNLKQFNFFEHIWISELDRTQVEVADGKAVCPYIQTVPDRTCLFPDGSIRKVSMSRRSPGFCAFMIRLSRVHVQIFRSFTRLSCVHQTVVHLCPDFFALTRLSCVHVQTFVLLRDFLSSPDFSAFMARLSGVLQTFVR